MKRSFWDRFAFAYDWAEMMNSRAVKAMVQQVGHLTPPGSLALDCAAGTGELALAMAVRARRVVCTDLSEEMLDRAKGKAARRGISNIDFQVQDLTCLEMEDNTCDAVAAGNVLHLLEHPERAVAELLRVTKPGGLVILPTFLQKENRGLRAAVGLYKALGFRPVTDFDARSYRAFLEGSGARLRQYTVLPGRIPVGLGVLIKETEGTKQ